MNSVAKRVPHPQTLRFRTATYRRDLSNAIDLFDHRPTNLLVAEQSSFASRSTGCAIDHPDDYGYIVDIKSTFHTFLVHPSPPRTTVPRDPREQVALIYFQLGREDHRWWWRSFFSGGSTGLFVYAYSFFYFFNRSDMDGLLQVRVLACFLSLRAGGMRGRTCRTCPPFSCELDRGREN